MVYERERLEHLRQKLLARRHALVQTAQGSQRALDGLMNQERIPEIEEDAQKSTAGYVLAQLGDSQRHEVAMIDAALARMDSGTYGRCFDCGADISAERLEAIPYAMRDAECSENAERRVRGGQHSIPTL